jgi:hypothetical protein
MALTTPAKFEPLFNLQSELARYSPGEVESVKLRSAPVYIDTILRALTHTVSDPQSIQSPPSKSAIASCCISAGIRTIMEHEHVLELQRFELELHTNHFANVHIYEDIVGIMTRYPVSLVSTGVRSTCTIGVSMSKGLSQALTDAAGTLGHTRSAVGLFGLIVILSDQKSLYPEHVDKMNQCIDSFFDSIQRRLLFGEKLMELRDVPG